MSKHHLQPSGKRRNSKGIEILQRNLEIPEIPPQNRLLKSSGRGREGSEKSALYPPAPIWPKTKIENRNNNNNNNNRLSKSVGTPAGKHVPFTTMQRNARYVKSIGMFAGKPLHSIVEVAQNEQFVSKIQIGNSQIQIGRQGKPTAKQSVIVDVNEELVSSPLEFSLNVQEEVSFEPNFDRSELTHDSIVTEALLQMTSLSSEPKPATIHEKVNSEKNELPSPSASKSQEVILPGATGMVIHKNEDMNRVIQELTMAMMKQKNVNTLTNAVRKSKDGSLLNRKNSNRMRKSLRALKRLTNNQGVDAMRELWERSGQRTNGRKLLVESLSENEEQDGTTNGNNKSNNDQESPGSSRYRRRRRKSWKAPSKRFPSRKSGSFASTTSSESSSMSSHEWQQTYNRPFSTHDSAESHVMSELYTEVYKGTGSPPAIIPFHNERGRSESSTRSKPLWHHLVEGNVNKGFEYNSLSDSQKRVTFDFEANGQHSNKNNANLPIFGRSAEENKYYWENYYGTTGKFSGAKEDSGSRDGDTRALFEAPFFDYRKKNSQVI